MKTQLFKNVCKMLALSMTVGTMLAGNGIVANAQPKVMKDGTIFDAEYYAQKYPDVVAAYGTNEAALFQHYTEFGKAENREGVKAPDIKTFDPVYYAKQNPDVVAAYGNGSNNLYQHYLQYGKKEGRKAIASDGTEQTTSSSNEKSKTSTVTENVQPQNSPMNEKVLRRGSNVTGWSVVEYQSQSEMLGFPIDDCFETASGVYVVCKGWVCQMFASGGKPSYGQHALWNLGETGSPYGSNFAQEGVHFWKIN